MTYDVEEIQYARVVLFCVCVCVYGEMQVALARPLLSRSDLCVAVLVGCCCCCCSSD